MNTPFAQKVQFLKPEELDGASTELLGRAAKSLGKTLSPPIPIEDIIEKHLRLRLEFGDLTGTLGPDVLGATWFDEGLIRVDNKLEEQEGRLCFTLAHEVGHWVLHRPQYEADKVTGHLFRREVAEGPPAIVCRSSQRKLPAEWQADQFSARVLMPERFVRSAFTQIAGGEPILVSSTGITRLGSMHDLAAAVIGAGSFLNVSKDAMRIRIETLNLVARADHVSRRLL